MREVKRNEFGVEGFSVQNPTSLLFRTLHALCACAGRSPLGRVLSQYGTFGNTTHGGVTLTQAVISCLRCKPANPLPVRLEALQPVIRAPSQQRCKTPRNPPKLELPAALLASQPLTFLARAGFDLGPSCSLQPCCQIDAKHSNKGRTLGSKEGLLVHANPPKTHKQPKNVERRHKPFNDPDCPACLWMMSAAVSRDQRRSYSVSHLRSFWQPPKPTFSAQLLFSLLSARDGRCPAA